MASNAAAFAMLGPTTSEAVKNGFGVIDGGATRTLGSVQAIEAVMQRNAQKRGSTGVKAVDLENKPVFGFADSGEAQCVSTIDLGLQANGQGGHLRIHALDKGSGPILVSVATLRALGAIIDFSSWSFAPSTHANWCICSARPQHRPSGQRLSFAKSDGKREVQQFFGDGNVAKAAVGSDSEAKVPVAFGVGDRIGSGVSVTTNPEQTGSQTVPEHQAQECMSQQSREPSGPSNNTLDALVTEHGQRDRGELNKAVQKMTKGELTAAIRDYGEIPAASWNMSELQLRHRLRELMDLDEEEQFAGVKTLSPLQQQIVQLNKQKRREADLTRYLEEVLKIPVNHNETMYQMEVKAMDYLYKNVESTGRDVVGFGRHAALTYSDLLKTYPQYTDWVVKTYKEAEDSGPRLQRLAQWLTRATDVTAPVVVAAEVPQGSRSVSSSPPKKIENEQEEIEEIRETASASTERPRKKEKEMNSCVGAHARSEAEEQLGCSRDLSQSQARILEDTAASIVPSLFQELVASDGAGGQRPVLMEVACSPDSLLTKAPCSEEECQVMAELWDTHADLHRRAAFGKRLMQPANGAPTLLPSLENISYNFLVMKEIVLKMSARQRLSADPADMLAKMFVGWYGKHKAFFSEIKEFDPVVWAFKDGWVVHKMITLLRPKDPKVKELWEILVDVKKRQKDAWNAANGPDPLPEALAEVSEAEDDGYEPCVDDCDPDQMFEGEESIEAVEGEASVEATLREASVEATLGEASLEAMLMEASVEATQREASVEATLGEASVEAMLVEASVEATQREAAGAVCRSSLTREEKIQLDSAELGYRLAHTTSETWEDEQSLQTPDEYQVVSSSVEPLPEPSLESQKTFLDESPAEPAVCTIESSPDEAPSSSRPSALKRRPHIPKTWKDDFSQKLTPEQKARFLEACKLKMNGVCLGFVVLCWQRQRWHVRATLAEALQALWHHRQHSMPLRNPDQEDTYVPEADPSLESLIRDMAPSPTREPSQELGEQAAASEAFEDDEPESPCEVPASKDDQMRFILAHRKEKKAKAAAKAIAADAKKKAAAEAKAGAKRGRKPKHEAEAMPAPESEGNANDAEGLSAAAAAKADDPKPKGKPGRKPKQAGADAPKPKGKPGPKPKKAGANDPEEPSSKPGPKPKQARTHDPEGASSKQGPKSKKARTNDPEEPSSEPGPKSKKARTVDPEEPSAGSGPKSKNARTDDPEEPVVPHAMKAKPKGKAAMKKPAARKQLHPDAAVAEVEQDFGVNDMPPPMEADLPKTFARRAMPTTAHGVNKYRRIVGAFRDHVLPKLKDRQKCAAEDPGLFFTVGRHSSTKMGPIMLVNPCYI
ncbi:unnamed protein product [Symbiodinium sp. CCMP2592]|nr:unnamed protein product [Symbiodinium sp. CCMP2592]